MNIIEIKEGINKINSIGENINLIDDDICIVCHEDSTPENKLILYQHGCGDFLIHNTCLENWYKKEGFQCIICRENIMNEENNQVQNNDENEPIQPLIQNISNINNSHSFIFLHAHLMRDVFTN